MTPSQLRSVDPFSSYHSDNVNRLNRILTAGANKISTDDMLYVTQVDNFTLSVSAGVCIKDDVMIQITSDSTIDVTDDNNWIVQNSGDSPGANSPFPRKAYLVLKYTYEKVPDPNVAEIKILKHIENFNESTYLFLALLLFQDVQELEASPGGVEQTDEAPIAPLFSRVIRQILNLHSAYTNDDARHADAINPITNHKTELENANTVVTLNDIGVPTLVSDYTMGRPAQQEFTSASTYVYPGPPTGTNGYNGSGQLIITHNWGRYPIVQIIDMEDGNTSFQTIPGEVHHINQNSFYITFYNPVSELMNETRHVVICWQ